MNEHLPPPPPHTCIYMHAHTRTYTPIQHFHQGIGPRAQCKMMSPPWPGIHNECMCVCCFRPEIVVGSKVLAKKFNDIWYSGVVLDLSKPENTKHAGEVGSFVSSPAAMICIFPLTPPPPSLNIKDFHSSHFDCFDFSLANHDT